MADPIPNRIQYPGNVRIDPITKFRIPKDPHENMLKRRELLTACARDPSWIPTVLTNCRDSFEFWCNMFVWTYRVNETNEDGRTVSVRENGQHVPFITWPVQDEAGATFDECMLLGEDQLWDKSREMGASWYLLAKLHHRWLFYKGTEIREMSRKEEYVDSGSSKSLFWKHDYINRYLPAWMRPPTRRKNMLLVNTAMESTIAGESTNKDAMRGDRAWAIMIDEAAAIENLEPVLRATDRAGPRIFNSTPAGPGAFADMRFSGKVRLVILPWWRHPERGAGAVQKRDDRTGQLKWTSPSYEHALATRTAREVAQNWDMDHAAAGAMFFDPGMIATHRATYAQEPWEVGSIRWIASTRTPFEVAMRKGMVEAVHFVPKHNPGCIGHLKLWCALENGRPPANIRTVIGADISHGAGASQSCLAVYDAITGAKVAELVDAFLGPAELADHAAMLGWWFGGNNGTGAALMVPENNGPGGTFIQRLQRLGYPHIYRHVHTGKASAAPTQTLGWTSNRVEKETKLGQYAQAMMEGRIQNRSMYAIDQCTQYVYLKSGSVGCGSMESADGAARAVHGDIVIADMLATEGVLRVGRFRPQEHEPPAGSVAWQLRQLATAAKYDEDDIQ